MYVNVAREVCIFPLLGSELTVILVYSYLLMYISNYRGSILEDPLKEYITTF